MPEHNPEEIPQATAASSVPPVTGTASDTVGLPGGAPISGVPDRMGDHVLLGELGRGGMGVVYRAEDPHLKREVAIKVMLPACAANPQAKVRFIREARAQAKVEHDHVAVIHQVAEHAGLPYLVMPLLKGMTLHAALKANPRPPLPEVARIGREIAEGLAAAHEKGLVHRDIKPANIWLEGKKLRVKVLDFGLARVADSATDPESDTGPVTREGAVIGTPAYMSPEQGRGDTVDARTDLWSLGVVLYQMTTGELPFTGPNTMAILTALAITNPPPPAEKNPAVPPTLSHLIMRLLAKEPAARPSSAESVAEELRAIEAELVNAVRIIPVDAPMPVVVSPGGHDPFAELDATLPTSAAERTQVDSPKPTRKAAPGFSVWGAAIGVLLVVGLVIGFVASRFGEKPVETVQVEPPKPVVVPKQKQPVKTEERVTAREIRRLILPSAADCVAVSPDEKVLAVGCADGHIHLLDANTGEQIKRLEGHTRRVLSVAFSPSGMLASGANDNTIRLWDTGSGDTIHTLEDGQPGWVVAFSPDGQSVVGGGASIWDVKTGKPTVKLLDGRRDAAAFVPGTKWLVVGNYHTGVVQLIDTTDGSEGRRLANWGPGIRCVALSPSGTKVAVAFGRNNPVNDQPIPGDDYSVRILDLETGNVTHRLDGHGYVVYGVRYSLGGEWLLTASFDGTARLWEAATGKESCVLRPQAAQVWGAALYGRKNAVTVATSGTVTFWELPGIDNGVVLFNGKDTSQWQLVKQMGAKGQWKIKDDYLEVAPHGGNHLATKQLFGDCSIHLEYWLPAKINANSGVYLQGCYEIQIFDDFGKPPSTSTTGALWGEAAPSKNASKPAEEWQSIDITFIAPRDGKSGQVTVVHNGEKVLDAAPVSNISPQSAEWLRVGNRGPIMLQDHGSPVRFRNIRVTPLNEPNPK